MRLVSLLPSATEIVYALGLDESLVGVTFECDEPPTARQEKTIVVGGRDTFSASEPAYRNAPRRSSMACGHGWPPSAAPDVVLVAPCGFHLDGAAAQARTVAARLPGLPVWAIDGDGLVVRPGPRLIEGVETIAAVLHPEALDAPPATAAVRVA